MGKERRASPKEEEKRIQREEGFGENSPNSEGLQPLKELQSWILGMRVTIDHLASGNTGQHWTQGEEGMDHWFSSSKIIPGLSYTEKEWVLAFHNTSQPPSGKDSVMI